MEIDKLPCVDASSSCVLKGSQLVPARDCCRSSKEEDELYHSSQCAKSKSFVYCCIASEPAAGGPVIGLATGNEQVYSVCQTGTIRLWDELDLSADGSANPFASTPEASAVVVCREWVVTAHKDFKIRVWRPPTPRHAASRSHKRAATLPSTGEYLRNWMRQHRHGQMRRHDRRPWMEHADTISALALSADGTRLYSASWDRTIKVWNLARMECEESFKAHHDAINAMVLGGQDGLLYTGSADKSVKVWSRRPWPRSSNKKSKHSMVVALEGQDSAVNALTLSRDCMHLYSGGSDGRILAWRRSSQWPHKAAAHFMEVQETLQGGHARAVLCLEMHPDESLLISGSADKTLRVWRRPRLLAAGYTNHTCLAVLNGHTGPVRSVRVSIVQELQGVGAGVVYSGSLDGSIKLWMLSVAGEEKEEQQCVSFPSPTNLDRNKKI